MLQAEKVIKKILRNEEFNATENAGSDVIPFQTREA